MRILQLCKKSPTPQKDGESIAIHQITKALDLIGVQVDVLAMLTSKHPEPDKASEWHGVNYQYVSIETQISIPKAVLSVFDKVPYIVSRFKQKSFRKALIELLLNNTYDVVILEGVFLGLYLDELKKYSKAKVVLRAHNIENQIWKRLEKEEKNILIKTYLKYFVVDSFTNFELDILTKVDGVVSISPIDNQYFVKYNVKRTLTIPVCVDTVRKNDLPKGFDIGFLGGMDWLPNRKGVDWFIDEVWVKFYKKHYKSKVRFHLAGRNFPDDLIVKCEKCGARPMGEIDDALVFIAKQSVMIAPIFSGSGMRVKIIEAMSLGKAVLSTTVGAEGINYTQGENIFIADTAEDWVNILEQLLVNSTVLEEVGTNAAQLVNQDYLLVNHLGAFNEFLKNL